MTPMMYSTNIHPLSFGNLPLIAKPLALQAWGLSASVTSSDLRLRSYSYLLNTPSSCGLYALHILASYSLELHILTLTLVTSIYWTSDDEIF